MSIKGPKSKDLDDFDTGQEPAIESSMPAIRSKRSDELTGVKPEPIFTIEATEVSQEIRIEALPKEFGQQIDSLRSQVERISTQERSEALTADQSDVFKKYISLKEIENRDLKDQLHQFHTYATKMGGKVEVLEHRHRELVLETENLKRREELQRQELRTLKEKQAEEVANIKDDYEQRLRKSGNYEKEMTSLVEKREQWRERVKQDLNRIKLKERELENRYELLKRDMQALLDSKDKHVLELKKRSDAQELELESLEERLRKTNLVVSGMDAKKRRLIETLRLALSLLETIDQTPNEEDSDSERKAG